MQGTPRDSEAGSSGEPGHPKAWTLGMGQGLGGTISFPLLPTSLLGSPSSPSPPRPLPSALTLPGWLVVVWISKDELVSLGSYNKSLQTWWLKSIAIDAPSVMESGSPKSRCLQGWFLLEGLKDNSLLPFLPVSGGQSWAFLGFRAYHLNLLLCLHMAFPSMCQIYQSSDLVPRLISGLSHL